MQTNTELLLATLAQVRAKLRERNRDYGRQSTTVHLTRLERDRARIQARAATLELEDAANYGRQMLYRLRELMEVIRPGMTHGELDDDYALTVAEIRRLRADWIVAELDARPTPTPRPVLESAP